MLINGTELAVLDEGDGPPVCFSHGLLWSKAMYRPQIEVLKKRYRCVSWDHRNQGESAPCGERAVTIDACTDDAAALIEQLDLGPVHFVGLSMGGFVGLRLAARRPELIRSLVLIDTAPDPEPLANHGKYKRLCLATRLFGVAGPIADRVMPIMFGPSFLQDPTKAELRAEWRDHLRSNRRSIIRSVYGVIERDGVVDELDKIRCPTLVLHGTEDAAIKMERAELNRDRIEGARMVTIPRAGHTSTIENPEAVTSALVEFLDDLS